LLKCCKALRGLCINCICYFDKLIELLFVCFEFYNTRIISCRSIQRVERRLFLFDTCVSQLCLCGERENRDGRVSVFAGKQITENSSQDRCCISAGHQCWNFKFAVIAQQVNAVDCQLLTKRLSTVGFTVWYYQCPNNSRHAWQSSPLIYLRKMAMRDVLLFQR